MKYEITPEKQRKLDKLAARFFAKSLWTGMHHGLMAVVMNIILVMGVATFFERNEAAVMVGSVLIGIFVFRRMFFVVKQNLESLNQEATKIIKE